MHANLGANVFTIALAFQLNQSYCMMKTGSTSQIALTDDLFALGYCSGTGLQFFFHYLMKTDGKLSTLLARTMFGDG